MDREPIFFAWTRSFWLTVAGIATLFFQAPPEVIEGAAAIVAPFVPWDETTVAEWLFKVAPAILWVLAIQQRSGAARPYTTNPRKLK